MEGRPGQPLGGRVAEAVDDTVVALLLLDVNEIVEGSSVQWAYLRAEAPGVAAWSGFTVDPRTATMAITSAELGLLTLPADVPQRYAAPALMIEGRIEGALDAGGREMELRFGRYLPLTSERALAEAGYASTGPLIPGTEVPGRAKGE